MVPVLLVLPDKAIVVPAGAVVPVCVNVIVLGFGAKVEAPVPVPPLMVTGIDLGVKPGPLIVMFPVEVPTGARAGSTVTRIVRGMLEGAT